MMRLHSVPRLLVALVFATTLVEYANAQATSATWTGAASGNWDDTPQRWNLAPVTAGQTYPNNGIPDPADTYDVLIPAGTGVLTQNVVSGIVIQGLDLRGSLNLQNALTANAIFNLAGGSLSGPATLTANGPMTWSAGSLNGTVRANGPVAISGGDFHQLGGTLTVAGAATFTVPATGNVPQPFTMIAGSVLNVASTGSFDLQSDGDFFSFNSTPQFNNAGAFTKSVGTSDNETGFNFIAFNNSGSVVVAAGNLVLSGGGSSTGSFEAQSGTQLRFGPGSQVFQASSSVTGAGQIQFIAGNHSVNGGYDAAGTTVVDGGTVAFNVAAESADVTVSDGNLAGSGSLTASSEFTWSGGTISGNAVTTSAATLSIQSDADKTLNGTFNNGGAGSWTSAGDLVLDTDATFNNQSGATFSAGNSAAFTSSAGSAATFDNAGEFTKSGPASTTTFTNVAFSNSGTVSVTDGTLDFEGGYTQTAGSLSTSSTGTVAGPLDIQGGSLIGDGNLNGNVENGGRLAPGFSAGSLTINGNLTLKSTALFDLELGGRLVPGVLFDVVNVTGAATLGGQFSISLINGFGSGPSGVNSTDMFVVLDATSLSGAFSNAPDGSRVFTTGGEGSFLVTYDLVQADVRLSDFQVVPEPGTIGLLLAGALGLVATRRRQISRWLAARTRNLNVC